MRLILYTGKGGVGKTSVAAATAVRAAALGHKTMVFSTDAAHSLGDSFDLELGSRPVQLAPNLWGHEIDVFEEIKANWGTIQEWVSALMAWRGLDNIVAEEMAILPGMEELASLLYIAEYHKQQDYDLLVVDCAPTGETLRLLSFPEMARWWMERMLPIERRAASLVRPLVKSFTNLPFPDDAVFTAAQDLFHRLAQIRQILSHAEKASVRLVVNAEKMVIKEAQRTFTHLNLYGYGTDLVICNRLIPEGVTDSYFAAWKESQSKYYQLIEESFSPIPIRACPLFDQEVVGLEQLERMGRALFGDDDPAQLFYQGQPRSIGKRDGYFLLSIPLPFVHKEEISLLRTGEELVVQAGRYRRHVILPRFLVGLPVTEAKFEGDYLNISFRDDKKTGKRGDRKQKE